MPAVVPQTALDFSPFLKQLVSRHPEWLEELQSSGRLDRPDPPVAELLPAAMEKDGLDSVLRRFRNREMMRIIWRELNQLALVDITMSDLSTLAEICLQTAVDHHSAVLQKQYGRPRGPDSLAQKLVVICLGKLGGFELNMSSDIDIIFCYPENGVCDGRRGLSNEQFFTRLARKVINSLADVSGDGFCFRVDTRLRPFGVSGPLVSSFAALEQYYQREGRDWERYALIKARPVAGDLLAGKQLLAILKPFVYRRYIDFGAIEAMHDMHESVRVDTLRRDRLDDIKRGPGGIREIEFLVQAFQLLRGGREPSLQTPSLISAATALEELRLLTGTVVKKLLTAYRFLRRTENCIQALHDQQTHQVPGGEDGARVARAMGFDDQSAFQTALDDTRKVVQALFVESLPHVPEPATGRNQWHSRWQQARNDMQPGATDLRNPKPLSDFVKRLDRLSLSQRASRRLDQFMPQLLEKIELLRPTDTIVDRVLDLISAICRRSVYLSLLVQNPDATDRMLGLFAASEQVAKAVTRYPSLLDELIDPRLGAVPPTRADIHSSVDRVLRTHTDTETSLQNLNYLKRAVELRINVAVLQSTLSVFEAQAAFSRLAQNLIRAALVLAKLEIETRHGHIPGSELAVIAYGSLGARALRIDSDLDLIFLYQPSTTQSDGSRAIPSERYHTSVARRMLNLLSATTPSGRLYGIDARLRPNGRAGLLVSSVDAFSRYQRDKAWVWELQALTRARPVAGNSGISERFKNVRRQVLTTTRDNSVLNREVLQMRKRVRDQHADGDPLKHGPGGLVDIEFVVQLGVLLNAHGFPGLVCSTLVTEQLQALRDCGWISQDAHAVLNEAYTRLSQARQTITLLDDSDVDAFTLLEIARTICSDILNPDISPRRNIK